jgi:nucleotide-binding universal stress UspA family protein
MLRTILAGCDGFERGREAVAFAATLARATGARLHVVAAHLEPPLPFPASSRERAEQIDRAIRRVRDELAPQATATAVHALSPAHALRHAAEREHADLIVVGSRRHGRLGRILEADHALQVLHSAPQSVAVVPDGVAVAARLERIVVGFDGSPEAAAALDLAADIARRAGAQLWLQAVVDDRQPGWSTTAAGFARPEDWTAWLEEGRIAARALVDRAVAELAGVDADGGVAVGNPARELAHIGASADLLVLGSRRWGPVSRVALGSTSEAVVRRAAGPVLVMPRGAGRPEPQADYDVVRTAAP